MGLTIHIGAQVHGEPKGDMLAIANVPLDGGSNENKRGTGSTINAKMLR